MLDLAGGDEPRIPILNTAPSKASWPGNSGRGFSTSILNCMIQGSASSFGFLSCLLVASEYLNKTYDLNSWFCASVHDEYQYAVPDANIEKAAYLFQIAHAWCWALAHYSAGLNNVPISTLFADAVNIDRVWRKEAYASVETPTNTNVLPGKELTMNQLNEIAKSSNYWDLF